MIVRSQSLPPEEGYLHPSDSLQARRRVSPITISVGVVYPLLRFAPALYGWSMRRRVFRLYGELKLIEAELDAHATDAATLLRRLDHLEERADHLQVPLAFAQTLYHMRSHIGLARARLQPHPAELPPQAPSGR